MSKIALRRYNTEINDMIDHQEVEEAIAHCLHILNIYPKYVETYRLLGKAYLESKQFENAADVFQRVLSSHPDDFVANVGMSIISESNKDFDSAIHFMERAFEEQPSNHAIQEEMKRLFGRRDGVEPTKVRLTRGALARMYVHGNLYDQAVAELLSIINESPQRLDLLTILAETYYAQDLNTEAADVCMTVLNDLPYSYLANRIMYLILTQDERTDQAQEHFSRWVELDPYAEFISPPANKSEDLPDNTIEIEKLEPEGEPKKESELTPIEEKLVGLAKEKDEPVFEKSLSEVEGDELAEPPVLEYGEYEESKDIKEEIPEWLFSADKEIKDDEIEELTEAEFVDTVETPVFELDEEEVTEVVEEDIPDLGFSYDEIKEEPVLEAELHEEEAKAVEEDILDLGFSDDEVTDDEPEPEEGLLEEDLEEPEETPDLKLDDDEETMEADEKIPDWLFSEDEAADDEPDGELEESAEEFFEEPVEETDDEFPFVVPVIETEEAALEVEAEETVEIEETPEEDDWLSSLEKDSTEEKDTWPSLIGSEDKPVINTGSLELEDAENLDWLSDLVDDDDDSERPDWEKITETLPSILEEEVEELTDVDVFAEAEETVEEEADDMPVWMASDDSEVEEEAEPVGKDVEDKLPDWIESEDEVDVSGDLPAHEEAKDEFEKLEEEADEAWLSSLGDTIKTDIKEDVPMPDWLKQIDSVKDIGIDGEQFSDREAEEISSLPEDDLPDWLKELKEEEFGGRLAEDDLIGEEEQEQEIIEEEAQPAEAEQVVDEVEEDELVPDLDLEEDDQDEDEAPEWMEALRGIAQDIPDSEIEEKLEEVKSTSELKAIEIEDEDVPFDLEEEFDAQPEFAESEEIEEAVQEIAELEEVEEIEEVEDDELPAEEQEIKPVEASDWVPEIELDESEMVAGEPAGEDIPEEVIDEEIAPVELEAVEAEGLGETRRFFRDGDLSSAGDLIKKAIRKGKNLPEVIEVLEEGLADHPIDVNLWQLLGDAFMRQDKLAEAMEAYTNAEDLLR